MIGKLMPHRAIRLLGLMAMTPLLIGHGVGGCFPWDDSLSCSDPVIQNYVISGSVDPGSSINFGYNLNVQTPSVGYTSPIGVAGGSVPPVAYHNSYNPRLGESSSHNIFVNVNFVGADNVLNGGAIGEMWVHSIGKSIKLIHPAANASYLSVSFAINDQGFNLPQSSTMTGTSSYSLSGGSTGSEVLEIGSPIVIYVNDVIIYTQDAAEVTPPIALTTAIPGGVLRIVARGAYPSSLPSIWLHTPDRNGIKLSHAAQNRNENFAGVFFDVWYVLQ